MFFFFLFQFTEVRSLNEKEDWQVHNTGVTDLPGKFNTIMREVISVSGDVLVSQSGEEDLFARQIVQKRITQLLTDLFMSFPTCIEKACFIEASEADQQQPVTNRNNPPIEQMLIIGLSNMKYAREKYLGVLMESFEKLNFPDVQQTQKVCSGEYANLTSRLFEAYIEHRVEPLIGTIEPSMYIGDFDWNDCPKPTGISYVLLKPGLFNPSRSGLF